MRILALALATALVGGCAASDPATDDTAATGTSTPEPASPPVDDPPASSEPTSEPTPGPAPVTTTTVPERFQGRYAADAAACATPGHVTELTIAASQITFHESSGPITSVTSGGNGIAITAQLSGEGETRQATYGYRLSDDGDTLTDIHAGMARQRCD